MTSRGGRAAGGDEGGEQPGLPGTRARNGGRQDRDGTSEVIKIADIKQGSAEVMKLYRKAETAKTSLNEALKALAERSGTNTGNLKKLFKASYKGNFAEARRDLDQQTVLFEQVGEIAGGAPSGE